MPYNRRIIHLDTDATTQKQVLSEVGGNSRVTKAWFELLRQGGCGAGEITLKDAFANRGDIAVSEYVAMDYDTGDRWYLGRVESVTEKSPTETVCSLHGMSVELTEVFPGGFGGVHDGKPHRYNLSDAFPDDPDHGLHTVDLVSQPHEVVNLLQSQYILPQTNINTSTVEAPSPLTGLDSILLRGEESAHQIMRSVAIGAHDASWGVDETGDLFFRGKRNTDLATFQEGVDLESLSRTTDRSLLFNSMLFTGGYVYGVGGQAGYYRYRAIWKHFASVTANGERRLNVFLPWIRRDVDAKQFADEFFRKYSQPFTRYSITTNGQSTLIKPWDGEITLLAADDTTLVRTTFDRMRVEFDHVPTFGIVVGPEDLQFPAPPEPQRWEINPTGQGLPPSIPSLPTFSGSSSQSTMTSSATSSGTITSSGTVTSSVPPVSSAPPSSDVATSGIASGSVDECINCTSAPLQYVIEVAGVIPENGACAGDCTEYNGTIELTHSSGCNWNSLETLGACNNGSISWHFEVKAASMVLTAQAWTSGAGFNQSNRLYNFSGLKCLGTTVLTREGGAAGAIACDDFPATITIMPVGV